MTTTQTVRYTIDRLGNVTLTADDGRDRYVQVDTDVAALAVHLGCPAAAGYPEPADAIAWLEQHEGETFPDPGYFE